MSQPELVTRVVQVLDALGVEYLITGSIASSAQGVPRSTHDVDLVVALRADKVDLMLQAFPAPEFYLSRDAIADAIGHQSMFNLLHVADGGKADFWIMKDEPFDRSRLARKVTRELFGVRLYLSAPEDTILAKLHWAKQYGGSEKQFTDALRVFEVQRPRLDLAYLDTWVKQLGVEDLWARLQSEAQPL
jgi:hypothetical protein